VLRQCGQSLEESLCQLERSTRNRSAQVEFLLVHYLYFASLGAYWYIADRVCFIDWSITAPFADNRCLSVPLGLPAERWIVHVLAPPDWAPLLYWPSATWALLGAVDGDVKQKDVKGLRLR